MKKLLITISIIILAPIYLGQGFIVRADETTDNILQINDEIQTKKDQIKELNKKIEQYQKLILNKQKEATTLNNQIDIINNQVNKINLEIESTEAEIDELQLEIKALDEEIKKMEEKIKNDRDILGNIIRAMEKEGSKSEFEIVFLYNNFSEFFDHLFYLETIQDSLNSKIKEVKNLKNDIEKKNVNLNTKKSSLETLHTKLRENKSKIEDQKLAKSYLLKKARDSESRFKQLADELRNEQGQINSDIVNLESTFRKKLEESDKSFSNLGQDIILSWPLDPKRGLSATFHDPDYPFRYIYEHPAIDIRAYQGTPVKAAAAGFVAKVIRPAYGNYSYIMLIHRGGFSTVYGHLSRVIAQEGAFVDRGQIIAYSGGMPGTAGAGRMTTGPHLHFETRLNGLPVDPMSYLLSY